MSRLITFGCSYTWGVGLPDDGLFPSKVSWPALVAKELNLEIVNKGEPAASNTEILYEILTFDYKPDDCVIVMWTHCYRDVIFSKWGAKFKSLRKRFGTWKKDKSWQNLMNETDYNTKSWMNINHADLFLKSKQLKYLHYPARPDDLSKNKIQNLIIDNICNDGFFIVDKGSDNLHPGVESHNITAKNIVKVFNGK